MGPGAVPSVILAFGLLAGSLAAHAQPATPTTKVSILELAVNVRAARGLSLTIPPSVLGRADQIIE